MSDQILELGRKPISDASPVGAPCRDDLAFEALQTEFQKLERADQSAPDWSAAIKGATELLSSKSKDLLVASYLSIALLERDGYSAFADGLEVVRDIAGTWWDTMFPERPRGRQAALQFLGDRGSQRVMAKGTSGATRADIERALEAIEAIEATAGAKLEGGGGQLTELRRSLNEQLEALAPAPSAEPAAQSSASAASAPSSYASSGGGGSFSAPGSVGTPEEFDAAANAIKPLLRSMAEFRRTQDARDPLAYRLPRLAAWITVKQAPPANGGKTSIPAPQPADAAARIEAKLASQAWAGVLEETEGRIHMAIFWLDPHFYAWSALKGMGAEHASAAEAVAGEVKALLRRFPELPELTFDSGMPLANDATRAWIKDVVLAAGAAPGKSAATSSGPQALAPESASFDGLAEAKAQAAEMAAAGQVGDAVRLLEAGAVRATRARERAAWKIAVAEACADAGRPDVALAQLEALQDELQSTRLDMWDPELSAQLLRLVLWARQKALPATQMNAEEHQKSRDLLKRLARLDAAAALDYARPAQ